MPHQHEENTNMTITETPSPTQRRVPIQSVSYRLEIGTTGTGFDLNHPYVETFWLPTIGPTSTLMLRFVGRHVHSSTYATFEHAEIAFALGVGAATGRDGPVAKTIKRLSRFDLATIDSTPDNPDLQVTIPVEAPPVPPSYHKRWPEHLRILHSRAVARRHIAVAQDTTPGAGR